MTDVAQIHNQSRFIQAVKNLKDSGVPVAQAMRQVCAEQPALHQEYLESLRNRGASPVGGGAETDSLRAQVRALESRLAALEGR